MHQPYRVGHYSIFDVGISQDYFKGDKKIFQKVADKSYRPMLKLLEGALAKQAGLKFSLSITGTFLEQAEAWAPDVVETLRRLVATERVEIVAETYYHSLAFFYDRAEFEVEVEQHLEKIQQVFGVKPRAFRNTELAYNDALAEWAEKFGFEVILSEGWDRVLGWQSPNWVYRPADCEKLRLLTKNYRLSDDVAFRFSNRDWSEYPLTVEKYLGWLEADGERGPLVNLFMDFETFGEHQWADTGIFEFFEEVLTGWVERGGDFLTVSEAANSMEPKAEIAMPETVTWADTERDLTAWMGNAMQQSAMEEVYGLRERVLASGDAVLVADWRRLLTSDHAYYMCTKYFNDGDVHAYFSPYDSPYDAFMYYMNVVRDVEYRLRGRGGSVGIGSVGGGAGSGGGDGAGDGAGGRDKTR
jgi:alpha-amylase